MQEMRMSGNPVAKKIWNTENVVVEMKKDRKMGPNKTNDQ